MLDEKDWQELVLSVLQGGCVLMLGPDALHVRVGRESLPIMEGLARYLRQGLDDKGNDFANFTHVAQMVQVRDGHNGLLAQARSFFKENSECVGGWLEDLVALPFRVVVNTTPAPQLETVFRSQKKPFSRDHYDYQGSVKSLAPTGTAERPLIYYLYGHVSDPRSLVLSENNLLDFLVSIISKCPDLPENIRSEFRRNSNCFLFVGFGLKNWYLRILLHLLHEGAGANRSFALEKFSQGLDPSTVEETKLFFQQGHRIHFFDMPLKKFTAELRQRCEKELGKQRPGEPAAKKGASVFLCHASEDKAFAENLSARLKERGLSPWLDKEQLRGGDRWDRMIEGTISEEVDYVVVLQSKALSAKLEGYVNKEIHLALERQTRFRAPIRFIVPTKIDETDFLEDLEHLQTIDLTGPAGIEALIDTIERDLERRAKR